MHLIGRTHSMSDIDLRQLYLKSTLSFLICEYFVEIFPIKSYLTTKLRQHLSIVRSSFILPNELKNNRNFQMKCKKKRYHFHQIRFSPKGLKSIKNMATINFFFTISSVVPSFINYKSSEFVRSLIVWLDLFVCLFIFFHLHSFSSLSNEIEMSKKTMITMNNVK